MVDRVVLANRVHGSLASRFIWMNLKVKLCAKRVVRTESVWLAIWFGAVPPNYRLDAIGMEWPWASFRWLTFLLFPSPSEIVSGALFCHSVYSIPCSRLQFGWNHCEGINLWMKRSPKRRIGAAWLLTGRLVGNCSRRNVFAVMREAMRDETTNASSRCSCTMAGVFPMGKRLFNKTVHVRCLFSLFARTWPHPMKRLIWLHMPMLRCRSSLVHVCAPALQCASTTNSCFAFVLQFFSSSKAVLPIFLVSIVRFSAANEESLHRKNMFIVSIAPAIHLVQSRYGTTVVESQRNTWQTVFVSDVGGYFCFSFVIVFHFLCSISCSCCCSPLFPFLWSILTNPITCAERQEAVSHGDIDVLWCFSVKQAIWKGIGSHVFRFFFSSHDFVVDCHSRQVAFHMRSTV